MENTQKEYLFKEFESLKREIEQGVASIRSSERFAVSVAALVWTWTLSNKSSQYNAIVIWVPLVFSGLLGIQVFADFRHINRISRYLSQIENSVTLPEPFGWEKWLAKNNDWLTVFTHCIYWILLLLVSLLLPLLIL